MFVSRKIPVIHHSRLFSAHSCFQEKNLLFLDVLHNDILESTVIFVVFRQCFFKQSSSVFVMIISLKLLSENSFKRKTLRRTARQGQMADEYAMSACGKNVSQILHEQFSRNVVGYIYAWRSSVTRILLFKVNSVLKSLLWSFNHEQNASVNLRRRYEMNFIREG